MDALLRPADPEPLRVFAQALAGKDPKTMDGAPAIATTVRYTLPSRQQLKEQLQRLQG
jgi:hypothetical protein